VKLTKEDLTDLEREFPLPKSKKSLAMLWPAPLVSRKSGSEI